MTGFDTYAINNYYILKGMGGTGGVAILVRKVIKSFAIDMSQCNDFIDAARIRIQGRDTIEIFNFLLYCISLSILFVFIEDREGRIEKGTGIWFLKILERGRE